MQSNTGSMINRTQTIGDPFPNISPIRRKKDGTLFPLSPGQCRSTRSLIRKECCNYDSGICLAMNSHHCTQEISCHVWCRWFQDLLLPLDPIFEAEIFHDRPLRKCSVCGTRFLPASPRSKYCPACASKVRRMKNAAYKRSARTRSRSSKEHTSDRSVHRPPVSILAPEDAENTAFSDPASEGLGRLIAIARSAHHYGLKGRHHYRSNRWQKEE